MTGTTGALIATLASASAIASAAGRISEQWNGADTGSGTARRTPKRLADFRHAVERGLVARQHDLCRLVVVGDLAHLALAGCFGDRPGDIDTDAEQRRHGALADRNSSLHGLAAQLQKARRIEQR